MNAVLQLFRFILYKNIFIGFCSLALFQSLRQINGLEIKLTPASIFIFSSTVLYYNFHDLSIKWNFSGWQKFKESFYLNPITPQEKTVFVACVLLCLGTIFLVSIKVLILLFFLGILSLLYSIPIIFIKGKNYKIREVLYFKLGLISVCWGLTMVLIPVWEASLKIDSIILVTQFISVALFIYALCIPFEIRDVQLELSRGLRTIPIVYGIKFTRISGLLALIVAGTCFLHLYLHEIISLSILSAYLTSLSISVLFILLSPEKPSDFYCKFYVDGMMILQFLLIFVAIKLS